MAGVPRNDMTITLGTRALRDFAQLFNCIPASANLPCSRLAPGLWSDLLLCDVNIWLFIQMNWTLLMLCKQHRQIVHRPLDVRYGRVSTWFGCVFSWTPKTGYFMKAQSDSMRPHLDPLISMYEEMKIGPEVYSVPVFLSNLGPRMLMQSKCPNQILPLFSSGISPPYLKTKTILCDQTY